MTTSRLLAVLAAIVFVVALVLALVGGYAKAVEDLTLGGFVLLAGAHAV